MGDSTIFFLWYIRFMWESKIQLVLESLQDECSLVSNSCLQCLHDIKIPLKYTSLKRAIAKCCLTHCQWAQQLYLVFCKYCLWFGLRCCHNPIWLPPSLWMMLAWAVPLLLTWTSPQGAHSHIQVCSARSCAPARCSSWQNQAHLKRKIQLVWFKS